MKTRNALIGLPIRAASTLILRADAVLLVKRGSGPNAGLWSAPGGRSNPGEPAIETARRELLEETGLGVHDLVPVATIDVPEPPTRGAQPDDRPTAYRIEVFAARAPTGTEPHAASDAAAARFVTWADLENLATTAGLRGIIDEARRRLADVERPCSPPPEET